MPPGTDPARSMRGGSDIDAAASARAAVRLSRGITATWWYTAVGIVFIELMLVVAWTTGLLLRGFGTASVATVGAAGLVWAASTVPLLRDYRVQAEVSSLGRRSRTVVLVAIALACGVVASLASGLALLAASPVVTSLMVVHWPSGIRRRLAVAGTVLLGALWFVDARTVHTPEDPSNGFLLGFYSTLVPLMVVLSVWWWDVLVTMDRARAAEGRLAATQERLRVATDVHDLQGHHLQVIALQLELAERLLPGDPDASLEQIRAARASVDEARQGTRDLATGFRSAPLADELANAVDLLRASGTAAESTADADVTSAPADVLGPVIRETTTNALRYGGGEWARLSLTRHVDGWRFEMSNDAGPDTAATPDGADDPATESRGLPVAGGSGLVGIERRVAEIGGSVDVRRSRQAFTVVVTVPAGPAVAP